MNLKELIDEIKEIVEHAKEYDMSPDKIPVSLQINDGEGGANVAVDNISCEWDNNLDVSGFVVFGTKEVVAALMDIRSSIEK